MADQGVSPSPPDRVDPCLLALARLHRAALEGVQQANAELARADAAEDWECWDQWRGYRKALLEVLLVTDRLDLGEGLEPRGQRQVQAATEDDRTP